MSELIRVPDIGNGEGEVIELMVKVGDRIEADQSVLTLESDKASMEIPAPKAGVIKAMKVKLGDRLKEGDELFELEIEGEAAAAPAEAAPAAAPAAAEKPAEAAPAPAAAAPAPAAAASVQDIHVPDIGSSGKAKIIELMVKVGDSIQADQSLITLESDKASMEIPSPAAGVVESIEVKLDQEVGTGDLILKLKVEGAAPAAAPAPAASAPAAAPAKTEAAPAPAAAPAPKAEAAPAPAAPAKDGAKVHAGPAVRQLAREFGVELNAVSATGPHGRVLKEDVQAYVKAMMQKAKDAPAGGASGGMGIQPIPEVDFSRFGEIEEVPMTRLMQLGATGLHRSWLNIPHVTQFDQADITELEAFRVAQKGAAEKAGVKLTVLPLLLKSCAHLLKELPDFNASLAPSGKAVIRKKYVHIGFAVDTPDGLLVPVIRDVDQKSLLQLAAEAAALAEKARTKKLTANDMQGACFTISSLGHIGGTGFTPIVNAPEVAILGVSKATIQPVWDGKAFQPKLMLPLSLSYDHRVINGAAAARFTKRLSELLADIRTILL
ncbi:MULTISPECIES: dihydrolipoyllysine-residue acetyltransferase [Pseudomonas syringae group]|uniref:Acetyltransferase component of pyruvate dehydrogenase complex n=1 Tax=Pseudomonas viridiflava TaxID=33069 RepID=A0A1Y6JR49_PSEVI|nr:dihydrolipoyllysine-residue acetyltransferase [Pseudomonas viridiflava]MBD8808405.1 dihydrolipoyllysine-residue acetyltransferase [Pseudomonas syringae]VVN78173.1 Dihydrolipoyllysine-residue acetyltransferase component of pyruvate dehydrogenase complex [Pseudomonas fluorescens]KIQ33841.1 dihydrolipoamide acetyltransferase [Pseudomonas viridiflava]MCI3907967.1 dihydrolipoyllysine-residue acetyltransferase [Pseudomonas viridiflava]MEE4082739.1 dihydrolipoyllysine-residue acetyltransferase [Ps